MKHVDLNPKCPINSSLYIIINGFLHFWAKNVPSVVARLFWRPVYRFGHPKKVPKNVIIQKK